jgi:hypothetical protein
LNDILTILERDGPQAHMGPATRIILFEPASIYLAQEAPFPLS